MPNKNENTAYLHRLRVIDLLRGLALIVMALDHSRDYFGYTPFEPTDLAHTNALLFLTRWITHLAPTIFFFLAGVGAFLYGRSHTLREQSAFLFTRGVWLIFLEVTVISFSWNFSMSLFTGLQVIWALGVSMIVLSGLIWLPFSVILTFSLVLIFGHNSLDHLSSQSPQLNKIGSFLHAVQSYHVGPWVIYSLYPLIPWVAVMSLGYCLGPWFQLSVPARSKRFIYLGCACLLLFILLRYFNIYGDHSWSPQARGALYSVFSFINVSKYPPSLQYLLITLGLGFLFLPCLENWHGRLSEFVLCFGKVPLFFYILHLYILSSAAVICNRFIYHLPSALWTSNSPSINTVVPSNYHIDLSLVYLVWLALLLLIYPLCRRYQIYKATHNYRWLSYL